MTEQKITNGRYRLFLEHQGNAVKAEPGLRQIFLGERTGEGTVWEVASDGAGGHTLRNTHADIYLGSKNDPTSPCMMLEGTSGPFAWKITEGPESGTVSLSPSASNGAMRLSLSLLRIFPPQLAWFPPEMAGPEPLWRLEPV